MPEQELTRPAANVPSPRPAPPTWQVRLAIACLVLAAVVVYANSLNGVFVYDDMESIFDNLLIRHLWPPSHALSLPYLNTGMTVARRPMLSLSFALNHHFLGREPWGYHLVNVAIHAAAALVLFGIVRRTLCLEHFRGRFRRQSVAMALPVALVWLVHPLHTESVTYIVQRAESLMGLCYLLTVYCGLRGFTGRRAGLWCCGSVLACAVGMGVKEVAVTAPVMVFLYDAVFISRSYRTALARRRVYYTCLAATWTIILGLNLWAFAEVRRDFVERSPWVYALCQPGTILYYLKLSVWPWPLSISYWPEPRGWLELLLPVVPIAVLMAISIWGLCRRTWYGFLGGWFFLILAPSSSFVALRQQIHEHRMYLPLAALVVLAVVGSAWLLRRLAARLPTGIRACVAATVVLVVTAVFGLLTHNRNKVYYSRVALWTDTVKTQPKNVTARCNLGVALVHDDRPEEGIPHLKYTLSRDPKNRVAAMHLGIANRELGRLAEAKHFLERARELNENYAPTYFQLALVYADEENWERSEQYMNLALALSPRLRLSRDPMAAPINVRMGIVYDEWGNLEQATACFIRALEIDPNLVEARFNLGVVLEKQGRLAEAASCYLQAIQLQPNFAKAHNNLGYLLQQQGALDQAAAHYRMAVQIHPEWIDGRYNLANTLFLLGRLNEAEKHYQFVIGRDTDHADARVNFGKLLERKGLPEDALALYENALRIDEEHAHAKISRDRLLKSLENTNP